MKSIVSLLIIVFLSLCAKAQIVLSGYKCLFYDGQGPNTMAEMYHQNDTFRFTLLARDIAAENPDENDRTAELKIGLRLCFNGLNYSKTKDGLYVSTGRYRGTAAYYYKIYIPEQEVSLSLRSNANDADFSDRSKWLLEQVRINRSKKKDFYFINEQKETCQVPPE